MLDGHTAHLILLVLAVVFALVAAFASSYTPKIQWVGLALAAGFGAFLFA